MRNMLKEDSPYRYFCIHRVGNNAQKTKEYECTFKKDMGIQIEQEAELMQKYGIVSYMMFRSHTRYVKACQKMIDDDPKNYFDMIATFYTNKIPEGFTTIDLGDGKEQAQHELHGLNMFKIDLRTKKGKQIFNEFYDMKNGVPGRESSLGEYIAKRFGLYHQFVPEYNVGIKGIYNTIVKQTSDKWLIAVPRLSFTDTDEMRGISDDYIAESPVEEISRSEYFKMLREIETSKVNNTKRQKY